MGKEIKKMIIVSISDTVEIVAGAGIVLLISCILGMLSDITFTALVKTIAIIALVAFLMSFLFRKMKSAISDETGWDKIFSIISAIYDLSGLSLILLASIYCFLRPYIAF